MRSTLTIVEDGTAVAAALATWLERRAGRARRVTALGPADVDRVVAAREGLSERILALTGHRVAGAALDGSAAFCAAAGWLDELDPFAVRSVGADRIEARVARADEDARTLLELARRASAETLPAPKVPHRPRGRPPGSTKHFAGVELDVCIAMLVEPARGWSERELARATGRSPYGVHRALAALDQRGYLTRTRGQTALSDAEVLRDDVSRTWTREARDRAATWFVAPRARSVAADAWAAVEPKGARLILAGASATDALTSGPTLVYADGEIDGALREAGFVRSGPGRGQLVVWPPPTPMVFYAPRELDGRAATNRAVTYLDLVASEIDRYAAAAEALWAEP